MGLQQTTRNKIDKHVNGHEGFKLGNISASVYGEGKYAPKGRLPDYIADQLNARNSVYVVYSYQTPIGWCNYNAINANWFIRSVRYSNSTTHHQHVLEVAVNYKRDKHGQS